MSFGIGLYNLFHTLLIRATQGLISFDVSTAFTTVLNSVKMAEKDGHSPEVIARRWVESMNYIMRVAYLYHFFSLVKQFYEMLSKNPSELHKFYAEQSFFLHSESSQVSLLIDEH